MFEACPAAGRPKYQSEPRRPAPIDDVRLRRGRATKPTTTTVTFFSAHASPRLHLNHFSGSAWTTEPHRPPSYSQ